MNVFNAIAEITGQEVTLETPLKDLHVDSLEYLDLMLALGADPAKHYDTIGDIERSIG